MRTTRWRLARGSVLGMLAVALLPWTLPAQESEGEAARVQDILESFLDWSGAPGVSVAWGRPGSGVRAAVAGVVREGSGSPVVPDDRFHAGSIGKTFTAATVLAMVRDGTLDLDAPLSRWLGQESWYRELPNAGRLTLRHLLSHTSGIPDHVDDPDFGAAVAEALGGPNPDPDFVFSPRELVGFVLNDEPLFEAGQDYAYSDTNYILLGLVVEEVTGRDFYGVLRERFLEPLELAGTTPADRRAIDGIVTGYNRDGWLGLPEVMLQEGKLLVNPANSWTGGGMVSTPRDLARWILALAEGRTALGREGFELMRGGAPPGADGRYGLGLSLGRSRHGPTVGHDGIFPGYRAKLVHYLDHDLAIAAMTNQNPADLGSIVDRIAGVLLGREREPVASTPEPDLGQEACEPGSHHGLTGTWRLGITFPSGVRVEGTLELEENPDGRLRGTWSRLGLETPGRLEWRLEGGREEEGFEVASVAPPTGEAASEVGDVDRVGFRGTEGDQGLRGEFFLVLGGERRDLGMKWTAVPTDCGG